MVILWAVLWRLNDEPASLQFDLMMVSYLGPGIAYYWRKPDARREKNPKKKHTRLLRRRSQKIAIAH